MTMKNRNGFTLIELLLALAIIGILAGLSVPVYRIMLSKNDLSIAAVSIAQGMRRAQMHAQAVDGDTGWGIKVATGASTVFQGKTYAARIASYDEITSISPLVLPSGLTEVDFTKFTGTPSATGSLTLTTPNDTQTITVNVKGVVSY